MDNEKIIISKSDLRHLVIETAKALIEKPTNKTADDAKRRKEILSEKDTRKRQALIRENMELFRR